MNSLTLRQWQKAMEMKGAAADSLPNQRNLFLSQMAREGNQEGDGKTGVSYKPDDAHRPMQLSISGSGACPASRSGRPKASVNVGRGRGRSGGRGGRGAPY